jgi:iron complex outermembrane receptor protein
MAGALPERRCDLQVRRFRVKSNNGNDTAKGARGAQINCKGGFKMKRENSKSEQARPVRSHALAAGVSLPALAIVVSSFGLTAFSAQSAYAADTDAATDQRSAVLEEVMVTARKREESLQSAPVSVSATSGAVLEQAQVRRLDEIAQFAPSLNIVETAGFPSTPNLSMRGIGFPDPILTADSPVAMYVDGVYLGRTGGAMVDLLDVERIEVLRGPQGSLFGRNTPGGAIGIYTRAPAREFGIDAKVGYASDNEINSTTTLNTGEIADSGLTAKIAYRHHQMDGYLRNTMTSLKNSQGADNTDDVAVAVRYEPVEQFTADYKFDYRNQSVVPLHYQLSQVGPAPAAYFGNSPNVGGAPLSTPSMDRQDIYTDFSFEQGKVEVAGHSLALNYAVNDAFKIKSITAYRSLKLYDSSDLGNSGRLMGVATSDFVNFSVQPVYLYYAISDHQRQHQLSEELQFGGQYQDLNYIVGLYYFDEHVAENAPSIVTVPIPDGFGGYFGYQVPSTLNYSGTSSSKAAFTQVSYALTDKLELTGGARYTQDRKSLDQNDTNAVRNLKHSFHNFSVSASVKYEWTDDLMTYVRFSEGYKAGGYSARAVVNGLSPDGAYEPEEAVSYEIGVKTEWFDHRVRLNADIFTTDYNDLQISNLTSLDGRLVTNINNAGKARFRGGELEFTILPFTGWQLNGTVGYVDPEYKSYLYTLGTATTAALYDISKIARFTGAAKTTASASVQYEFAPLPAGSLTVRTDWTYIGQRDYITGSFDLVNGVPQRVTFPGLSDVSDATRSPGFSAFGAQMILDDVPLGLGGHWMMTLYGKNLLNDFQRLNGLDLTSLGVIENVWGRGRVVGFNVDAKF